MGDKILLQKWEGALKRGGALIRGNSVSEIRRQFSLFQH